MIETWRVSITQDQATVKTSKLHTVLARHWHGTKRAWIWVALRGRRTEAEDAIPLSNSLIHFIVDPFYMCVMHDWVVTSNREGLAIGEICSLIKNR